MHVRNEKIAITLKTVGMTIAVCTAFQRTDFVQHGMTVSGCRGSVKAGTVAFVPASSYPFGYKGMDGCSSLTNVLLFFVRYSVPLLLLQRPIRDTLDA